MERQTITNQNADRAGRLRNQYLAKRLKAIKGSLKNCIDSHGPITRERIQSAAKRIHGQLVGMEREELKMTQQTSTTEQAEQDEQPTPTPQTALQYLARIGTLEGLLEQARQRRDKAELEVAELRNKCEAMTRVCDAVSGIHILWSVSLKVCGICDIDELPEEGQNSLIETVGMLDSLSEQLKQATHAAVAEYRKQQESTKTRPAAPGLALVEPDRRGAKGDVGGTENAA